MNNTSVNDGSASFLGISAAMLGALAAALLAIFVLAKPSEAQETNIIIVEPTEVGFGAVQVGTDSKTNTIFVRNTGDAVVQVGIDVLGGTLVDFELVGHSLGDVLTIQPGGSEPLQIKFSPNSPGQKLAELNFSVLGGGDSPIGVNVSGTATTNPPNQQPGAQADCDIIGTPQGEKLTGTPGKDVICALGGNDRVNGRGNNDIMRGGSGRDRIYDHAGKDKLLGQSARDTLNAKDGQRGDLLKGGGGKDKAAKDKNDKARSI